MDNLWNHPLLEDWQYEVANGDTIASFADWLATQKELAEHDAEEL